ncbi:hypothetical protein ACIRYZ_42700 [Kitasatospora sp. NPDC101155]|uniref:hypothetical protein n=1 Tax=Kitasatospora sp. NPDC101155 TaxID=3364097 RepID=UPI0037FBA470
MDQDQRVRLQRALERAVGVELVLAGLSSQARRLLEITGTDEIFTVRAALAGNGEAVVDRPSRYALTLPGTPGGHGRPRSSSFTSPAS